MSESRNRARRWREFCRHALGSGETAPLREANGATIEALTKAFVACFPLKKARRNDSMPDFSAELYSSPWSVYVIRNEATGEAYVGEASKGFVDRYPRGEWWTSHHNPRLMHHAVMYGARNFRIAIHVCVDRADMKRVEAQVIRMHRPATYNDRPEPDNHPIGE